MDMGASSIYGVFFCGISGVNILEEAVTSIPENFGIVSQETSTILEQELLEL